LIETIMVPLDSKMQRVPVLTSKHLKVYGLLIKGTDINELVADRKTRHIINELCRLGWVKPRAERKYSSQRYI
jgi:hypothetical protein